MTRFGNAGGMIAAAASLFLTGALVALPVVARTAPLTGPEGRKTGGRVPAEVVGSWTWGTVNPGQYVNKYTGEYVGHAGGGAITYAFTADGIYRRYVLIHMGAGYANENIFSSMEGKVTFDEAAKTFTVRFTKGTITFEKKSGLTRRPLSREDMERGGTVFTYRIEKDKDGNPVLIVNDRNKPTPTGTRFYKDADPVEAGGKSEQAPKP